MVVGGQLADHRHHRVGVAQVVGRHVGQVLDLAHDVVAEVAHDPAVQRREVVEGRGPPRAEDGLDGGEDALVERARPSGSVPGDLHGAARGR